MRRRVPVARVWLSGRERQADPAAGGAYGWMSEGSDEEEGGDGAEEDWPPEPRGGGGSPALSSRASPRFA